MKGIQGPSRFTRECCTAADINTAAPIKFSTADRSAWFEVAVPSPARLARVWLKISAPPRGSFVFVALTASNRTLQLTRLVYSHVHPTLDMISQFS